MSNLPASTAIESALILNDLSKLTTDERLSYYNKVCSSLGLNPLTQPFAYITLNGKMTLYAKRDATEQLRKVHKVSINITKRETIEGVYVVTAKAIDATGREDESTGAVTITGLKGEQLANAFLKAETKAKRRVTLSICGLGLLDETEVESIPQAQEVAKPKPIPKSFKEQMAIGEPPKLDTTEKIDDSPKSMNVPYMSAMDHFVAIQRGKESEKALPKYLSEEEEPIGIERMMHLTELYKSKGISDEAFLKRINEKYGAPAIAALKVGEYEVICEAFLK